MRRAVRRSHDEWVTRQQFFEDPGAPVAQGLLAAAFAIVRNDSGEVLLVLRADDGNWELPGGRIEVGESAASAAEREVAEEAGVTIRVTGLAGVYSAPHHVLAYSGDGVYQQIAICFHARPLHSDAAHPDRRETVEARWFDPAVTTSLTMHPTMRRRLADAVSEQWAAPWFD